MRVRAAVVVAGVTDAAQVRQRGAAEDVLVVLRETTGRGRVVGLDRLAAVRRDQPLRAVDRRDPPWDLVRDTRIDLVGGRPVDGAVAHTACLAEPGDLLERVRPGGD